MCVSEMVLVTDRANVGKFTHVEHGEVCSTHPHVYTLLLDWIVRMGRTIGPKIIIVQ